MTTIQYNTKPLNQSTSNLSRCRIAATPPIDADHVENMKNFKPVNIYHKNIPQKARFRLEARGISIPHPEKEGRGEDAFYISNCGTSVGVADGVGGWVKIGIDSGVYATELMENAKSYIEDTATKDPLEVLQTAYDQTTSTGTSTACLVTLDQDTLRGVNLGDSGFYIIRPLVKTMQQDENSPFTPNSKAKKQFVEWQVVEESQEQQHYFNCPLQLGTQSEDEPHHSHTYEVKCEEGDLVFVGTDGFLDNISALEVCEVLSFLKVYEKLEEVHNNATLLNNYLQELCNEISRFTSLASKSKTHMTPFAKSATQHGHKYEGGKLDDITIVTGYVVPAKAKTPVRCYGSMYNVTPEMNNVSVPCSPTRFGIGSKPRISSPLGGYMSSPSTRSVSRSPMTSDEYYNANGNASDGSISDAAFDDDNF